MMARAPSLLLCAAATLAAPQSCVAIAQPVQGETRSAPTPRVSAARAQFDSFAVPIAQAATRFAIPESWIRAVMAQESGGDPTAVSRAGAMGLMQIMPATWSQLRAELGLGFDPFDPRDNIFAGAAYLRAMYDRYGLAGMLAAYNAGPGRYEDHVRTGRALPAETRAYLTRLLPLVGGREMPIAVPDQLPPPPHWTEAALFPSRAVVLHATAGSDGRPDGRPAEKPAPTTSSDGDVPTLPSLFIARSGSRP